MSKYYPSETKTGNPVYFSAPNGGKIESVTVPITLSQDLHGHTKPWAAGAGVNLFDVDSAVYYTGLGGSAKKFGHAFTTAGTYALKLFQNGGSGLVRYYIHKSDNSWAGPTSLTTNGTTVNVASGDTLYVIDGAYTGAETETGRANAITLFNNWKVSVALSATQPDQYYPYSNVCPISGMTGLSVYVSPSTNIAEATAYTEDWTSQAGTVCSGSIDIVSGVLTIDMVNIASYAGETITEPWVSSLDEYSVGATPTTGAQVVYTLATPQTYQLTAKAITVLQGSNYLWSSTNVNITVVYALIVPDSDIKLTFVCNSTDLTDYVERDSYRTSLTAVYGETIRTINGVGHTALLRLKGELRVKFNPQSAAESAAICTTLLNSPCEVRYRCLQRNAEVTALMTIDSVSASYLSRCLYLGQKWNQMDDITLTEL